MSWMGRVKKHHIYKTIEKQGGYKNKCEIGMYTYGS